jgi:hypothetical protein
MKASAAARGSVLVSAGWVFTVWFALRTSHFGVGRSTGKEKEEKPDKRRVITGLH